MISQKQKYTSRINCNYQFVFYVGVYHLHERHPDSFFEKDV